MHQALDLALEGGGDVVAAMDINTTSNEVYKHNYPEIKIMSRNIAGLTVKELEKLKVEMVLMSPPCQPHTRQGHQKDIEDPRSSALTHLSTVLPILSTLKFVLLENVAGFETSEARQQIKSSLEEAKFECQEFLLCPRQIGIPNSRLRYYLLARRQSGWGKTELQKNFSLLLPEDHQVVAESVGQYLEEGREEDLVDDQVLAKRSLVLDIVTKDSGHSCCFTAGYTRYSEGTGSVVQQCGDREEIYAEAAKFPEKKVKILKKLGLRYFSPKEVSRLLGFPPFFSFPCNVGPGQQYKALGNSLNVRVVCLLIQHLIKD